MSLNVNNFLGLNGKAVIVTGAGRGIGQATAKLLAQAGARVAMFDRDSLAETEQILLAEGLTDYISVQGSVTENEDCKTLAGRAAKELGDGTIHGVANVAGITADNYLTIMPDEDWSKVIEINLGGTRRVIKAADPYMFRLARKEIKSSEGPKPRTIVNVSSVVGGNGGNGTQTNYAASKAGVEGFTRAYANECNGLGIRVNAVAPGFIDTRLTQLRQKEEKVGIGDEHREAALEIVKKNTANGRPASPDEVAKAILFLSSDLSSYVHGAVLTVDGGLTNRVF